MCLITKKYFDFFLWNNTGADTSLDLGLSALNFFLQKKKEQDNINNSINLDEQKNSLNS